MKPWPIDPAMTWGLEDGFHLEIISTYLNHFFGTALSRPNMFEPPHKSAILRINRCQFEKWLLSRCSFEFHGC